MFRVPFSNHSTSDFQRQENLIKYVVLDIDLRITQGNDLLFIDINNSIHIKSTLNNVDLLEYSQTRYYVD